MACNVMQPQSLALAQGNSIHSLYPSQTNEAWSCHYLNASVTFCMGLIEASIAV